MFGCRLTNDKMKAYSGKSKGTFKTSADLEAFGKKQNEANELLATNINDLIKRVCALEDQKLRDAEIIEKLALELSAAKSEIDRLKLTAKLNTNAIDRLSGVQNSSSSDDTSSGGTE